MANNIAVTPGSGKIVAGEEITSVLYQQVKLIDPTAASTTPIGNAANPLQVSLANTAANGTPVAVSGPLTDTQLRATPVPVSGTVTTGGLTDTQLRATPVPVSGTVTANLGTIGAAATAANQATEIASLASIDTKLTNPLPVTAIITAQVPGTGATNLGKAEDAAHASGDVGVFALAVQKATPVDLAADGDYAALEVSAGRLWTSSKIDTSIPAGTNVIGQVNPQPTTAGGCLVALMGSADGSLVLTNAAQAIKASAGQLYGWYIYNPNATAIFVSIYNVAAGSVTVGTTNPQMSLCIPPTSAANILGAVGIEFTNAGFSAAATTTGGGNTAPGTGVEAQFFYK